MALATVSMMQAEEPTVVFAEDFSAFTEGSEDAPATTDISSYSSGKLSKTLSGWSGKLVYEAGGMLMLGDGGNLKTTRYNMSANNGVVRITCRYRSLSETGALLKISLGYSTSKSIIIPDGEWHEIVIVTAGGTSLSTVSIEPSLSFNGSLIDYLSVEQSADFFPAPEAYQPSDARGTTFTAKWKSVSGATGYYLDVYSKDEAGNKQYAIENELVEKTSKAVEGLDENTTYYFVVRATNGTGVSENSEEVRVVRIIDSLLPPEALTATDVTKDSFTANWLPSEKADGYELTVYRNTTITEEGEVTILSENFDGVTKGSFDNVEFGKLQEYLDDYTVQPLWYAVNHAFAAGNIVLSPFAGSAYLITPDLDLENNNGKFTVKANMCAATYGTYFDGEVLTVSLLDSDDNVLESQQVTLESGYKDYPIEFTKGAKGVRIKFEYSGSKKIFFDDIAVLQVVPAGFIHRECALVKEEIQGTGYTVALTTPLSDNVKYSYTVCAYAESYITEQGEVGNVYSVDSDEIEVSLPSSVAQISGNAASVAARNGAIAVTVDAAAEVTVSDLTGRVVYAGQVSAGTTEIAVAAKGVVLVKVAGKVAKLAL